MDRASGAEPAPADRTGDPHGGGAERSHRGQALAHYEFEAINPFLDRDGRIGRLLIPLMLSLRGALETTGRARNREYEAPAAAIEGPVEVPEDDTGQLMLGEEPA